MTLADRVKLKREELNMTQVELARKMGYSSKVSISKIENGRPVTQKIIARLAEALNTTPAFLMGWEEQEKAAPSEKELLIAEIVKHLENLTPDQMKQVIQYAQFLKSTQG